jgi:tetratricopeptide (TPR) repeat protein
MIRSGAFIGLLLSLLLSAGCRSASERDTERLKQEDPAGFTAVQRMREKLAKGRNLSAEELTEAKALQQRYPAATEVRQVLVSALQLSGDWTGVAELIALIPSAYRTHDDQVTLIKAYLKLGRNGDAAALAGPLADANPTDVGLNNLAGQAWFNLGDQSRATTAFDRVWPGLIGEKQIDAVVDRGLIYFYQGAYPKAIETLKTALGMDADSIPANNALARVYAAMGDQQQAAIFQQHAEQIHAKATTEEATAMRLVGLGRELEAAFREKRYGDCVAAALQIIPIAQPATQATAYQYLGQCYQGQGNAAEAQKANEQAARLQQQR